ncbi:UDP-N-acetylglucosamine 1-carboxyvinyltransferase [Basilea psittacipulmonis]|uniref:UDP-N-acetylglucosamine 1-carboxyvinyltransferase n=1 Tax=Basilea psittacipulmonis DSM 24701 TaxID=1072685 RepID=A0A077DJR1_9BURK|nr:UDP-N-acetylglucosamine 1-carboxyvinyltransferase [Basilea psittacipulmonis]AIL33323.1 UDP-N-acetylglucosamine 1-carboxyvinyltransferase [Basilea psittacipulmonis DSM 24701]
MDKLRIVGGNPLHGEITISGAKNAALPILFACLLTDEPLELHNVPTLNDIDTTVKLLTQLGVNVQWNKAENKIVLQASQLISNEAPYELVKTMRASILALGPLLARLKSSKVSLPGGCAIGLRPVDQHIKGLERLGATITVEHGFVYAQCDELTGNSIRTDMVTVGGTEQFLLTAVLAKGTTILENAAKEPEVVDLANLLNAMGAKISGHGTDRIVIQGVPSLHGATYRVVADRIETGTFLCALGVTGGELWLRKAAPDTLGAVLDKLIEAGMQIETGADWIHAKMDKRPRAVGFKTSEYPGFPTDMQAQLMAMNVVAEGSSVMVENIFENRFMHVPELMRMGAKITLDGHTAVVEGVPQLYGAKVMATDLRASASLVIAALAAEGETIIDRIYHLDRGYDQMAEKLRSVGAVIERISTS